MKSRRARSLLLTATAWLLLVGAWWLFAAHEQRPGTIWATPGQILGSLVSLRSAYVANAVVTLKEAALGFILAVSVAVVLALAGERYKKIAATTQRAAVAIYSLPIIALAPALVLWTGPGLTTKVVIAGLGAFFPVLINLVQALRTTPAGALELMQVGGAGSWQVFRRVELPYALPILFVSFMTAAPAAITGAMLAEWVGANAGLGIQLLNSMNEFDIPQLYATLVVASALSVAAWLLFRVLGRLFFPWQTSVGAGHHGREGA